MDKNKLIKYFTNHQPNYNLGNPVNKESSKLQ